MLVPLHQGIEVVSAEDILGEAVPIKDSAVCGIVGVAHDGAEDLEDGGDAAAGADHDEAGDVAALAADIAGSVAEVGEFADGAFDFDGVGEGELAHCFGHFSCGWVRGGGGQVEFY